MNDEKCKMIGEANRTANFERYFEPILRLLKRDSKIFWLGKNNKKYNVFIKMKQINVLQNNINSKSLIFTYFGKTMHCRRQVTSSPQ